ncbi:hypothetical protein EJB05_22584, partial [Eragrostis curvula]
MEAAAEDCGGRRRFTVACVVLSQRVRADAEAAKMAAAALASPSAASSPTMLLMPGADVASDARPEPADPSPAKNTKADQAQLTIMYGGRIVVVDDVPEHRALELMRVAARSQDVPMRVAAVRRRGSRWARGHAGGEEGFMAKRRDRLAARVPYGASCPEKKGKAVVKEAYASSWLGLGIPGECRR